MGSAHPEHSHRDEGGGQDEGTGGGVGPVVGSCVPRAVPGHRDGDPRCSRHPGHAGQRFPP